ncbi:MAG: hypothetical protein PHU34_11310 [Candidatus Methanoperedens sp.]|nr:hypothetical protein [Candidatus Methanoperedens sp.]
MVQLKRKAVEHTLAVGAGVAAPLAIEVVGKGKRVSVGKMRVKQSALVGGIGGALALVAGATETGVRGDDADYAIEFGAASLVTSLGLELVSRMGAKQQASLAAPDEITLDAGLEAYSTLERGAGFGLAEVKEY